MPSIQDCLSEKFHSATLSAFPQLKASSTSVEVTPSTHDRFGHYQFNSAMKLSQQLKTNPRSIAEKIINQISNDPMIEKLEVAGPGFINITLSTQYLEEQLQYIVSDPHLGIEKPQKKQRIIVEFSSPNTAKELHVGHLRSTIIGDCLARLFEFLGHDVLRLNHVGDWGTAFGMLIAYLKEEAKEVLTEEKKTDLSHLSQWYKLAKRRFDTELNFKKRAQLEVVALQNGDPQSIKAWEIICDISRRAYQQIYDLLDIRITERGESFYNPMLKKVVEDLEKKGLVTVSDGAKCVFVEGFYNRDGQLLPLMVQKSDGGYNYDTTDMAAIYHRIKEERADRIIIVTDAGQKLHFDLVFAVAEKAGYLNREKTRVDHVTFGLVLGPDGKKFRTREGKTEKLIDLIQHAIEKAKAIVDEREPDMPEQERQNLAETLGVGAIKYADLSCHRTGDYTFSYDRMLRFEGNTAAFLMYAYVRVAGIKRRVSADLEQILAQEQIHLEHPTEIALALHLLRFSEALHLISKDLLPNRLTDYLFQLAERFHLFFRDCRVQGSPEQASRLLICEAVAKTMKQGLEILGLKVVERM